MNDSTKFGEVDDGGGTLGLVYAVILVAAMFISFVAGLAHLLALGGVW